MPASALFSMDFSVNPLSTNSKSSIPKNFENENQTFTDISQNHVNLYDDLTDFEFATAICPNLDASTDGLDLESDFYYRTEDPYKDLIEMIQLEVKKEHEEVSESDQILIDAQSQFDNLLAQQKQLQLEKEIQRQEELLNAHPLKKQLDELLEPHIKNKGKEFESGNLVVEQSPMKRPDVFICFACGKAFLDELLMRKHVNDDHLSTKDYPFKCTQCYKKFNLKHHLERHLKTHNKEHVCNQCNTAFSTFEKYIVHKSRVHSLNPSDKPITQQVKCEKCGTKKSSEVELNRHKYWCYNSQQIKEKRLENKIRMSMSAPSSTNVSPAAGVGGRPKLDKRCDYCNQEFASVQSKIRHFQRKHPDKMDEANKRVYAPMVSPNLQFMCMECHRSFSTSFALKTHQKRHQIDSKQFACDICDRSYVLPSELRKHIKRVHEKNGTGQTSSETSPTGKIRERRGRPPMSSQTYAGTPVNTVLTKPGYAVVSPQTKLSEEFKNLGEEKVDEKMEEEEKERIIENMPDWDEL